MGLEQPPLPDHRVRRHAAHLPPEAQAGRGAAPPPLHRPRQPVGVHAASVHRVGGRRASHVGTARLWRARRRPRARVGPARRRTAALVPDGAVPPRPPRRLLLRLRRPRPLAPGAEAAEAARRRALPTGQPPALGQVGARTRRRPDVGAVAPRHAAPPPPQRADPLARHAARRRHAAAPPGDRPRHGDAQVEHRHRHPVRHTPRVPHRQLRLVPAAVRRRVPRLDRRQAVPRRRSRGRDPRAARARARRDAEAAVGRGARPAPRVVT